MRRQVTLVLVASVIAAPIPVALAAQTGSDIDALVGVPTLEQRAELRQEVRAAKRAAEERRAEKREAKQVQAVAVPPQLDAIALCESGGDPTAVSADGMYHGKYQFSVATWQAMGGSGLPSQAPEAEQDMRAAMLYAQSGPSQWPVCGS
jgi:uncharacterized membrane protein